MDLVKKFLLGNYSLTKTFWVIYFTPMVLYATIITLLREADEAYSSPWVVIILALVFKILCFIAIWNSSAKYTGKKIWFYLVRFYLAYDVLTSSIKLLTLIPLLLVMISK